MADHRLAPPAEAVLHEIALQVKDAVGICTSAGVTLVDAGQVRARAYTDGVARDLDEAQSEHGQGPCVDALRFLQIFNVASMADGDDWPAFRPLARAHGILSCMAVPLCRGGRALGTISLYSRLRNGFKGCEPRAMHLASGAAVALSDELQLR